MHSLTFPVSALRLSHVTGYSTIVIDPPWAEHGGGGRGAQNHYGLLNPFQIREAIWDSPFHPANNAHLWLWVTDNFLLSGLWLMDQLGFTYKRTIQWVKVKGTPISLDFDTGLAVIPRNEGMLEPEYGIGQYARGAHETLLLGVRGKGMDPSVFNVDRRNIPSVILTPVPRDENNRRIHSKKPPASYELIEGRSRGPYLELFAREHRPGWDAWGHQLEAA